MFGAPAQTFGAPAQMFGAPAQLLSAAAAARRSGGSLVVAEVTVTDIHSGGRRPRGHGGLRTQVDVKMINNFRFVLMFLSFLVNFLSRYFLCT